MKLSTRIIVGWVALFVGGMAMVFNLGDWCFIAAVVLSSLLRTRFEPRIPREVERRRNWILMPPAILYLGLGLWLDVPESATHPIHVVGGIGFVVAVAYLIRDDIGICRRLQNQTSP